MMDDDDQRAKKHNKSRELELLSIRNIMKTENGRAFMHRCLQNCCTFESIFSTDTHQHAFNAGARSHGLWLDAELKEAATDDYFKMLKEHHNE
jgi:hypothetical protein|tara:strand:+ start:1403 stop:1681 length:279 start_codon:yes stop_codon:yes gene_type:complete